MISAIRKLNQGLISDQLPVKHNHIFSSASYDFPAFRHFAALFICSTISSSEIEEAFIGIIKIRTNSFRSRPRKADCILNIPN